MHSGPFNHKNPFRYLTIVVQFGYWIEFLQDFSKKTLIGVSVEIDISL